MRVINYRYEELALYWIDYSSVARPYYGKVRARNTRTVTTYGTHPWLIVNPWDEIVGIFVPYTAARDTDIIIK